MGLTATDDYKERISYDPNGNIQTYLRNGTILGGGQLTMDKLTYQYEKSGGLTMSNKLKYIQDSVANGNYPNDIDDQLTGMPSGGNYQYDAIGNLISDAKDSISNIEWTVYGKIKTINKTGGTVISYTYDASGNRISKSVTDSTVTKNTFYVRDASGNTMSVYTSGNTAVNSGNLTQSEIHLYGSSRLGVNNTNLDVQGSVSSAITTFTRGNKFFELSNHLGNVLVTISDKKIPVSSDSTTIDYYKADVVTANDYYPFGMQMPGRKYAQANSSYRYGFNGKENDNEIKGEGGQQDYGMRIYDPRLGRFLSVDPIAGKYPMLTPYQFASNSPIANVDLDGLEGSMSISGSNLTGSALLHVEFDTDGDLKPNYDRNFYKAGIVGLGTGAAVVTDLFVTRGKITQYLFTSQIFGHLYHNKANDPLEEKKRVNDVKNDAIVGVTGFVAGKAIGVFAKYMSGTFKIGAKTLAKVTEHLEVNGFAADEGNQIMLIRMEKIANKELKATEVDINFAKHELRESELMKGGKTYDEAHHAVLKEQGMGGMNVSEYQKKLYTQEALDASDAQWEKEVLKDK